MKRLALAWVILGGLALFFVLLAIRVTYGQDRSGLDLPVKPARFGEVPTFLPQPDPPREDDPRDTPPPTIYGEEIDSPAETVVYVLDKSGSMARGGPPSRMRKAKDEVIRSIAQIPNTWRFGVCLFSGSIQHASQALMEATDANKALVIKWVDGTAAGGSTATGPAMVDSFRRYDSDAFVLVTDGAPSNGITKNREQIRNGNTRGAVVNVYGIEAYGNFRAFCQGVASDNGGTYTDVN